MEDSSTLMGIMALAILLNLLALNFIIHGATEQKKHLKNEQKEINLLALMAEKLGVDPNQVNEILQQ